MAARAQTYGWILLLAFVLGGVIAPALHFNQHLVGDDAASDPVETVVIHTASPSADIDCVLCDATQQAPSPSSFVHEQTAYVDTVTPHAPQHPLLDVVGTTLDRGPPAVRRG